MGSPATEGQDADLTNILNIRRAAGASGRGFLQPLPNSPAVITTNSFAETGLRDIHRLPEKAEICETIMGPLAADGLACSAVAAMS